MDLLDEKEFREQQISKLSCVLNKYRDNKIPEIKKKKTSEKPKQLSLPFCG